MSDLLLQPDGPDAEDPLPGQPITGRRFHFIRVILCVIPMLLSAQVQFDGSAEVNTATGNLKLSWSAGNGSTYILERSQSADFLQSAVRYRGPDRARFISGLPDGTYFFRVKAVNGKWSAPVTVNVRHQSLDLALTLFGIGAVVFLLTVVLVVHGSRSSTEVVDG